MALSDCANCWETPCVCGHDYQAWTLDQLNRQIAMLIEVRDQKVKKIAAAPLKEKKDG